ncbi:MAG: hypothetical protein GC180_02070 [Bacteroidetes bacterium]|nr:hypothetical protein [Bacteroidota bacterium]
MRNFFLALAYIFFVGLLQAQVSHQFELVGNSRVPYASVWKYQSERQNIQQNCPVFYTLQYTRMRHKGSWNYGIHGEVGFYRYTNHYAFSEWIPSGFVNYNVNRVVHGMGGGIGYSVEHRLNTSTGSSNTLNGTYLLAESSVGCMTMRADEIKDDIGNRPVVDIYALKQPFVYTHLFLGLSHNMPCFSFGVLRGKLGADFTASLDNGIKSQVSYLLGIGFIPVKKKSE